MLARDELELLCLMLAVKGLLYWHAWVGYEVHINELVSPAGAVWNWYRWDSGQYVAIAQSGYGSTGDARLRLAFYPLFPWLERIVTRASGMPEFIAGLLISTIALSVVVIAMYRLVRFDYDSACAYRAVWFLLIFPTSYFFQIAYTESLFLALIITAFLACRHDRWLLAGALGAFAALTHDTGVLLVAALGAEALQRYSETRRWNYSWLWLGLIPVGLGVFLLINQCAAGNPLTFLEVAAEHWSDHLVYPWHFWDQLGVFTYMQPAGAEILGTQVVSYVAIALVASIVSSWSLRPSYFIWMATNWLVIAGQSWNLSGPRLVLIMFPMFLLEALASRNRLVFGAITIWSLLFLGLFSNEFSAGHWTF